MTLYQVKDWNDHFEGAKSRTYSNKSACQMPTKHGLGYKRLVKRKNGAALFGAWCALIQVLSRHPKERQGYCTDTGQPGGKPYTDTDLEMMTDIPAAVFKELLQVAASKDVEWLRILQGTTRIPQGTHADTTGDDGTIYSDSDSDSNSDSDSIPRTDTARPHTFKNWTADEFFEHCNQIHESKKILTDDEATAFYAYWAEPSPTGRLRVGLEKTWDTARRMHTWAQNQIKFQAKRR